jgi:hypothetical protein
MLQSIYIQHGFEEYGAELQIFVEWRSTVPRKSLVKWSEACRIKIRALRM